MSTPPSPNDLTRQQLDELDDLLQRMLTLPVSGATAAPNPDPAETPLPEMPALPSGSWRADAPTLAKSPYLVEPSQRPAPELAPAAVPEPDPEPELPAWGPDPLARYGATPAARLFAPPTPDTGVPPPPGPVRGVDAPALPMGFRSAPVEEPEVTASLTLFTAAPVAEPTVPTAPEPRPHSVPVVMWPVFALNWVLELVLKLFGPLGSVVTFAPTKHLLGLVGLLLLAASATWAARGMGWVAFDVPPLPQLPWQR
jgi:hypothetical protein